MKINRIALMHHVRSWITKAALGGVILLVAGVPAWAGYVFDSIDGGKIDLDDYLGRPVLVVNTASLCAFSGQLTDLQALSDRYAGQGVLVLAVPSNDFDQELSSGAAVKEFCALNYDLSLPMTDITHIRGSDAHPFYAWLRDTQGFEPGWNFNKVLLGPDGAVVATWGSAVNPMSERITGEIDRLVP
jgi:glutathione peroxidase